MADTWATRSWVERHFAEGIGFWEVSVFRALKHFYQSYDGQGHNEFRERLAFAFFTLGQETVFPADKSASSETPMPRASAMTASARNSQDSANNTRTEAPLPHALHTYERLHGKRGRTCSYCDNKAYPFCTSCVHHGLGTMFACGLQTKRKCMVMHAAGEQIKHASWEINIPTRQRSQTARLRTRAEREAPRQEGEGGAMENAGEEEGGSGAAEAAGPAAAAAAGDAHPQRRRRLSA
eukprot:2493732-Pleurochrysis_carterae.AAC.1